MLSFAADAAIGAYQRYLSPYKGFRCAYGAHKGRRSCSAYARAVVQRLGAAALVRALPRQFARCKAAYAALISAGYTPRRKRKDARRWENYCDCPSGCDPGALGACDAGFLDCSP